MAAAPLTRLSFTSPRRAAAVARAAGAYALMFANVGCSTPKQQSAERRSAVRAQNMTAAQPSSIPGSEAEDGQWVRPAKDYASTRYSRLSEITADNAKNLRLAWTFSTGVLRGHEAAPLVVNTSLYVVTPYPNILYALDLTRPGVTRWKFEPNPEAAAQGVACCDVVNRGASFADGKIVYNTLDGHTIAVDAKTGQEVWNTRVANINIGESLTMAPLIVKDKVFVGNSGGEFGVRGWLKALDLAKGGVVWTAYHTGPDADVLIGSGFKPYYAADRGKDLGVHTWVGEQWKIGGGTAWGWISYDRDLDLIYYGTGNPGPWNPDQRPGDNKWTTTMFARRADNGEAVWAYQTNPHDLWDYDDINEVVLLDLPFGGQLRKVAVRPGRNGYLYVIDRRSGQVLSADPYVHVTASRGVDLGTGRLREVAEKHPTTGRVVREVCPAAPGAKDWQPSAYSPRTGLLYLPHQNLCMDFEGGEANYIAGTPYVGATVKMYAGPGGHRGLFTAWDVVGRKVGWQIKEKYPVWSGALATAGDVVFYGTMDGWFKAVHAHSGDVLWQYKVGSGVIGQPISYRGPDGRQYVAVLSGVGGWSGAIVAGGLDPRDSSAALGFVNAMKDLPQATTRGGMLYVFALP